MTTTIEAVKVGFTGTRQTRTDAQRATLRSLLTLLAPTEFHHGAAVGADEDAALLARELSPGCRIVAHPGYGKEDGSNQYRPDRSEKAIHVSDAVEVECRHFDRNRNIVALADVLVAVPCERWEWPPQAKAGRPRGGTYFTARYAWGVSKPVVVIWPDGTVAMAHCDGVLLKGD